jgi:hypothetical protein
MTIISETGFNSTVIDHVKALHADTVRLGLIHPVEIGLIERFNSTCLGTVRVFDLWWFAAIVLQYADKDEIGIVPLETITDLETKIFDAASPMDLIRKLEAEQGDIPPGKIGTFVFQFTNLSYAGRMLNRIIILAEKQRRIWEPKTRFFAYAGVYPIRGQQGIAFISDFRVDFNRSGRLVLVLLPDPENVSGNMVRIAGQFEFL